MMSLVAYLRNVSWLPALINEDGAEFVEASAKDRSPGARIFWAVILCRLVGVSARKVTETVQKLQKAWSRIGIERITAVLRGANQLPRCEDCLGAVERETILDRPSVKVSWTRLERFVMGPDEATFDRVVCHALVPNDPSLLFLCLADLLPVRDNRSMWWS